MERKNNPRQYDPNRPVGSTFNYLTGQYEPTQDLSIEDQNQDLAKSLGVLPNFTPEMQEPAMEQEPVEIQEQEVQPMVREELLPLAAQPMPQQQALPTDLPAELPEEAPTQQPDLQQLISEYANAAREAASRKRSVGMVDGLTTAFQGLLGNASQTDIKLSPDAFRRQYEMADQPIEELEIRDRGTATQQRLSATQLDLQNAQQSSDKNSNISKAARDKYTVVMQQMGRPDLAEKITKGNMSATQLNSLFSGYKISPPASTSEQVKRDPIEDYRAKEEIKEDVKVKTENRKVKKEISTSLDKVKNTLNELKRTKALFERYSKNSQGGTGMLATAGGLSKYLSTDTQDLDSAFKKLNLDTMVAMFAGMSKAVDSDAERRAFEAAQAAITNDDKVNERIFRERISDMENLIKKLEKADQEIDRGGSFTAPEQAPEKKTEYPKSLTKNGKRVTVTSVNEEEEARSEGWM